MVANARIQNFTMTLPEKGPMSVPDKISFVADIEQEIDLTQLIDNNWLDYISGVYIDNTNNAGGLNFRCNGSNQAFYFPAGYSGYVPLFLPNPPKVFITSLDTADVTFQWYNVPVFPLLIPGPNATTLLTPVNIEEVGGNPVTTSIPVSGPLTDAELRATAVPVDGPLTDAELRATAVPVSGPLTDAELRATAVPVDGPLTDAELRATAVPVELSAPTITNYSGAMTGGSQTILTAGQAENYLLIYNPTGNGTVTVNIAGGDASLSGFPLVAGAQYENTRGIANAVTLIGTNTEIINVFAG
jgi:hypothetical protein